MMTRRQQAEAIAYALGISIFLGSEGELTQHGPGEEIRPPSNAHVTPLGVPLHPLAAEPSPS